MSRWLLSVRRQPPKRPFDKMDYRRKPIRRKAIRPMGANVNIEQRLAIALAGRTNDGPRWSVTGTDPRGEAFTIDGYRTRFDAADFAAECNGNGGNVKVRGMKP